MTQKVSIAKNIFFNGTVQVTSILLNIALLPYITGIFDSTALGINSFGQAIAGYFVLGGNLGITIFGARLIAETRDDEIKSQEAFSQCVTYQFFFNSLAIILYCVWVYLQHEPIYYLFTIMLITSMTDLSWAYTGKERFDLIAIRNFIIKIIGTISIFIFVRNKNQLPLYIVLQQGILLISNLVFWLQLGKINLKPRFYSVKKTLLIIFFPALAVFLPSVFSSIYMSLNKVMLGYMSTLSEVAIYDYPYRLIRIATTLIGVIGTVLMPRLAYLKQNPDLREFNKKVKQLFFTTGIFSIPIAVLISQLATPLCHILFHNTLEGAPAVLKWIAPTIITSGLSLYIIFVSINRMKLLTIGIAIGAVFNFFINIILIKYYSATGAAISTLLTEIAVNAALLYFIKDIANIKWLIKKIAGLLFISILCTSVIFVSSAIFVIHSDIFSILINTGLYILVYIPLLLIFFPSETKSLINNIRK